MGYEFPSHQIQYDAIDKETDQNINAKYTLEGTVLQNVDKTKYLGEAITEDLR